MWVVMRMGRRVFGHKHGTGNGSKSLMSDREVNPILLPTLATLDFDLVLIGNRRK